MSLKIVHIFFITACALLGVWLFREEGGTYLRPFGIALLILLVPYLWWFIRKMRGIR